MQKIEQDNSLKINILHILLFLIFTLSGLLLFFYDKQSVFIFINSHNCNTCDFFFKYITYLGDGIFAALILIFYLFRDKKKGLHLAISWAIITIIVQIFKRLIFKDVLRPASILSIANIHTVEGVNIHYLHSFPSGHTATAFMIFTFLALQTKRKDLTVLFFILACLVGYSRIYLAQHFFTDVYFGGLIAMITVTLVLYYFYSKNNASHNNL